MKNLFYRSNYSLNLYYFFLLAGIALFYLFGKEKSYFLLNDFHNGWLDNSMKVITILGDGTFAAFFSLIFIFYRMRLAIFLSGSWLVSGLIAQIFKRIVFSDVLRPHAYFNEIGVEIYKVEGIDIHLIHSFPSGHSATAFAIFIGLSFFVSNKILKTFLFILALLTAFSRVYLGQHFLADIIAGSAIGVLTSVILYKFVSGWKKNWLDLPIQKIIFSEK